MTVALSLKVHDGIVIAADSASTLSAQTPPGVPGPLPGSVINIYNNANKICNLCKGKPLGAVVWGAGSVGTASMSTLLKDLRGRFMGTDPCHGDWQLNEGNWSVESISKRVRQFIFEELYTKQFGVGRATGKPSMGILVAGYSPGQGLPESWLVRIDEGECVEPKIRQSQDQSGCFWDGQPEAINRFLSGYSMSLKGILLAIGVGPLMIDGVMNHITNTTSVPMIVPAMPIQDAIDLAEFLVYLTIMYSRFAPGAPSVGGPIECAAITKHEGFKWVKRKHYFSSELNPKLGGIP